MAEILIPEDLLELLRQVDTPTVCNAITSVSYTHLTLPTKA